MPTNLKHKLFLLVFCLASIAQGMYSTYFVSILTILERIYQIQSKTAGAIISATEIGQILGSLFIAYYGGRGNKPKWMSICMTLSAIAALISISPHFIQSAGYKSTNLYNYRESNPADNSTPIVNSTSFPQIGDLRVDEQMRPDREISSNQSDLQALSHSCLFENKTLMAPTSNTSGELAGKTLASTKDDQPKLRPPLPITLVIAIFSVCLLVIGFGSTAITTLGIPFIDDIISREESPLYLGLTIALRIFGPALGFILGSFCISLNSNPLSPEQTGYKYATDSQLGGWWLGLVIISVPLLILAIPMYFLSKTISIDDNDDEDYGDITYQAAEDHDIGGSHDFPVHLMGLSGDLDITSDRSFLPPELDDAMLQICPGSSSQFRQIDNYKQNISFDQPILTENSILKRKNQVSLMHLEGDTGDMHESSSDQNEINQWTAPNVCVVVNYLGATEPTNFVEDESRNDQSLDMIPTRASTNSSISYTENGKKARKKQKPAQDKPTILDLSSSLSRLLQNRLLVLRMLSGILHILPIAGFYTFLPKYLKEQFGVTSSSASAISGLAGILFVGFGAFIGGTIIRVFNVNSKLMTRWIAASALLYSIGMIILMNLSCDQSQMVHLSPLGNVSSGCSSLCNCAQDTYDPVCFGGTTFASPCLAGCKSHKISADSKIIYEDCGCQGVANATTSETHDPQVVSARLATQGQCSSNCDSIVWYVILFSIFTLIHSSCEVGSMMFNLRCVKPDDRTLALGLITFSSSLLGAIPCSVIYGSIVDSTCIHWDRYATMAGQPGSEDHGACRAYDNDLFRYNLHGLTALVMVLAFIVDCIISRRSNEVDFYDQDGDESKMDIRIGLKKSTETIQ